MNREPPTGRHAATTSAKVGGVELVVWLHDAQDPDVASWNEGIEITLAAKHRAGDDVLGFASLVISDGGAPDAAQRKQLLERVFEGKPHRLAVITNSLGNPIKRGVATAISWVLPSLKIVEPPRFREAIRHVGLERLDAILPVARELQRGLAPVATLATLERLAEGSGERIR